MNRDRGFPLRRVIAAAILPLWIGGAPPAGAAAAARVQQAPAALPESTLEIEHDPLPCLTTTTAPRVDATVNRESELASGRVYWRVSNGPPDFYYSDMTRTGARVEALLPRFTTAADSIEYSIEVKDTQGRTRRTASFVAPRVTSNCIPRGIVPLVSGLGLTIGLTDPRQPRIPAGVNADDVAQVTLASGETVPVSREDRRRAGAAQPEASARKGRGGISKGVLIGAGVLAAGGIAAAAGGGGGGGSSTGNPGGIGPTATPTATPTPTQPPAPTATPTVPFRFVQAEATWSGPGDVDVLLLDASGSALPGAQTVPAGCESASARTERVLLQGASVRAGGYQVRLTAKTCGAGTPTAISVLLTVQTDTQPKCPSAFVIVPVGQTVAGCSFTIP